MLTSVLSWLNRLATATGDIIMAPAAWLPGWLSITLVALVTGVAMLWIFKYTSNQKAIKRTRDRIKSNLLALSLFKDEMGVSLRCQAALIRDAGVMLLLSLVPMLVMLLPMCLILGQLALWYQKRPLAVGEEAVVTVELASPKGKGTFDVQLVGPASVHASVGPVRVPKKGLVCWNITVSEPGRHDLTFMVDDQPFHKELAVGNGFQPTSIKRPSLSVGDMLLHPREAPFADSSPVRSIEIDFPDRKSWTSGTDWWLVYWFAVSMVAAFAVKPLLNVNI
jgi:hypothetical protein